MKFDSYVARGDKCLVFLDRIFENVFRKFFINGKKTVFGTDTGKKVVCI